jgi:glutamate synthase domain-containing protein 1
LADRLFRSITQDQLPDQIEAHAGVRFMRRRLARGEAASADCPTAEDVIRLLGPFTIKEAAHIDQTGFDLISDHAFLNVPTLQEADELCELFARIEEVNRDRPNSIVTLRAGRVSL